MHVCGRRIRTRTRTRARTHMCERWTRTACSRACCVLLSRLRRLLPGMPGFRLTGLLTGLLPLVAFCILKTIICHILRLERGCASVFLSCTTQ